MAFKLSRLRYVHNGKRSRTTRNGNGVVVVTFSNYVKAMPGTRPTKVISIEFRIRPKFAVLYRSQRYFAHVMIVTLPWRLQHFVVMGCVDFKLKHSKCWLNFEFDRNSGTGARADSRFAASQYETALLSNDVSHWLRASLESALHDVAWDAVHSDRDTFTTLLTALMYKLLLQIITKLFICPQVDRSPIFDLQMWFCGWMNGRSWSEFHGLMGIFL